MDQEQARELTETAVLVREMHTRLFGNGQPGEIDKLHMKLDQHKTQNDARFENLETWSSRTKGAISVLATILSFLGWPYVVKLFSASLPPVIK